MEIQSHISALLEQVPRISDNSELCYAAVAGQQSPGWLFPLSGYNCGAALTYFVGFWNTVALNLSYRKPK